MSSSAFSSSRRRELIDRIRYPNPIPLPPYPPKLLEIATDPARYADPHFADRLASSHPFPVLVDAHAGMPIDLVRFQDLWEDDLSEVTVAPNEALGQDYLDDADAFLLQDFSSALSSVAIAAAATAPGAVGIVTSLHAADGPATAATLAAALQQRQALAIGPSAKTALAADDVTWLRRTEYLSAEQKKARQAVQRPRQVETVNTSREAQVNKIQQCFKEARKPLDRLAHPTKRRVTAVSSFELLPDPDTWATDYQVVRFIDAPGRLSNGVPIADPRLDVALFRPVSVGNEQRVSYYLPTGEDLADDVDAPMSLLEEVELEDEKARRLRKRRRTGRFPIAAGSGEGHSEDQEADASGPSRNDVGTAYKWVRDYVPKDTAESSHDVLLLSLDDGVPDEDPDVDVDPIKGAKRRAANGGGDADDDDDDDDDADLFGDDSDDIAQVTTTAVPQADHERRKRSRRSELTKGKERDAAPDGTGATLAFKSKPKAYYHKVGMRFTLRVWRSRVANNEKLRSKDRRYPGKWDVITLSNRELTEREKLRRYHIRSQVDDMGALDAYESSADEAEEEDEELDTQPQAQAQAQTSSGASRDGDGDTDGAGEEGGEGETERTNVEQDRDGDRDGMRSSTAAEGSLEEDEGAVASKEDAPGQAERDNNDEDDDATDDEDAGSIDADEELAALRAEAVEEGDDAVEKGDEGEVGGGRRSRRRGAAGGSSDQQQKRDEMQVDEDEQ